MKVIQNINEIRIGEHGLFIESENNQGILLPQVADEHNGGKETFLKQTTRKAGLSTDTLKNKNIKYQFFRPKFF